MEESYNEQRLAGFRKFLNGFVGEKDSPFFQDDPVQFRGSIVGSFRLPASDVPAEVLDWVLQFLYQRKCPQDLAWVLAREVQSGMEALLPIIAPPITNGGTNDTDSPDEGQYLLDSSMLYSEMLSQLQQVCCQLCNSESELALKSSMCKAPQYQTSVVALKNTRRKMEDRHVVIPDLNALCGLVDGPPQSYYAVFDGHSGVEAASFCSAHLHWNLVQHPKFECDPTTALREAFAITEEQFQQRSQREGIKSGCTAVCCLIRDNMFYLAWLGDSQAILVKKGMPHTVMSPHKPDRKDEKERVEKMGGCVMHVGTWRVNGILAVSRALGDFEHKPCVSSDPDIIQQTLDGEEDFLVLACDGLWDTLTANDVTAAVYHFINQENEDIDEISAQVAQQAIERGSTDNVTVIVVFLRDLKALAAQSAVTSFSSESTLNHNSNPFEIDGGATAFDTKGLVFENGDREYSLDMRIGENVQANGRDNIFQQHSSLMPEATSISELPTPPIEDLIEAEAISSQVESKPSSMNPFESQEDTEIHQSHAKEIASAILNSALESAAHGEGDLVQTGGVSEVDVAQVFTTEPAFFSGEVEVNAPLEAVSENDNLVEAPKPWVLQVEHSNQPDEVDYLPSADHPTNVFNAPDSPSQFPDYYLGDKNVPADPFASFQEQAKQDEEQLFSVLEPEELVTTTAVSENLQEQISPVLEEQVQNAFQVEFESSNLTGFELETQFQSDLPQYEIPVEPELELEAVNEIQNAVESMQLLEDQAQPEPELELEAVTEIQNVVESMQLLENQAQPEPELEPEAVTEIQNAVESMQLSEDQAQPEAEPEPEQELSPEMLQEAEMELQDVQSKLLQSVQELSELQLLAEVPIMSQEQIASDFTLASAESDSLLQPNDQHFETMSFTREEVGNVFSTEFTTTQMEVTSEKTLEESHVTSTMFSEFEAQTISNVPADQFNQQCFDQFDQFREQPEQVHNLNPFGQPDNAQDVFGFVEETPSTIRALQGVPEMMGISEVVPGIQTSEPLVAPEPLMSSQKEVLAAFEDILVPSSPEANLSTNISELLQTKPFEVTEVKEEVEEIVESPQPEVNLLETVPAPPADILLTPTELPEEDVITPTAEVITPTAEVISPDSTVPVQNSLLVDFIAPQMSVPELADPEAVANLLASDVPPTPEVVLEKIPDGVPEADGVTEDSDSEKDGGWSYVSGKGKEPDSVESPSEKVKDVAPVVAAVAAAATVITTTTTTVKRSAAKDSTKTSTLLKSATTKPVDSKLKTKPANTKPTAPPASTTAKKIETVKKAATSTMVKAKSSPTTTTKVSATAVKTATVTSTTGVTEVKTSVTKSSTLARPTSTVTRKSTPTAKPTTTAPATTTKSTPTSTGAKTGTIKPARPATSTTARPPASAASTKPVSATLNRPAAKPATTTARPASASAATLQKKPAATAASRTTTTTAKVPPARPSPGTMTKTQKPSTEAKQTKDTVNKQLLNQPGTLKNKQNVSPATKTTTRTMSTTTTLKSSTRTSTGTKTTKSVATSAKAVTKLVAKDESNEVPKDEPTKSETEKGSLEDKGKDNHAVDSGLASPESPVSPQLSLVNGNHQGDAPNEDKTAVLEQAELN